MFTVRNERIADTVVKLIENQSGDLILLGAVARQSEWTFEGIPSGTYITRVMTGTGWDPDRGRFQRVTSVREFDERATLGIRAPAFASWGITLYQSSDKVDETFAIDLTIWDSQ